MANVLMDTHHVEAINVSGNLLFRIISHVETNAITRTLGTATTTNLVETGVCTGGFKDAAINQSKAQF